jgi:adenylate cyclase
MNAANGSVSAVLVDRVGDWLMRTALEGADLETLVRGFCERLAAAGMPLARIHLSFSVLHPLYRAAGFTWRRGEGVKAESYRHAETSSDLFKRSPYYYLLSNNLDHLRRRIDGPGQTEFAVFDDLRKIGITDYLAFVQIFQSGSSRAMMGSWSTDSPEGFDDSAISALMRMQNQLAVAARMAVLAKLADNMLSTYLGNDAGKRVLDGQIKRGDGETIRAALVMADMRNSTMLAEQHGRQIYIETLNRFFDAVAAPFNRNGGQILSFVGDGFLAVFPCERNKQSSRIASRAALAAAGTAVARMNDLNRERRQGDLWEIGYGIGLHVGNVMFGNVGLSDRLTFSVFGAAANEVQRLESLTKKYPAQIVASAEFVDYCGGDWSLLGTETLRGFEQPGKVFTPSAAMIAEAAEIETAEAAGLSDAEHLVILHRGGRAAERVAAP